VQRAGCIKPDVFSWEMRITVDEHTLNKFQSSITHSPQQSKYWISPEQARVYELREVIRKLRKGEKYV
jgi:hypothetical protein